MLIFAFHGIGFASSQASHEVKKVRTTCNILLSVYTCYLSVGKIAPVGCLKLILAVHPLLFSRCTSSTWGRDSTRTPITPLPRTTASWLQFSEGNPPKTKTYCFTSALHISFVNHNKTVHFSFVLTNFEARTRLPIVYSYKHGFSGFSAMLTESQAETIRGNKARNLAQ